MPRNYGWVDAKPEDAIQDPPLRCRVKCHPNNEWKETVLTGYDRSDDLCWGVADDMQWATICEVWKQIEINAYQESWGELVEMMHKQYRRQDREDKSLDWNLGFNDCCKFVIEFAQLVEPK